MQQPTVRDLMLSLDEYATIGSECTIQEALVALDKAQLGLTYDRHHHRALLVLDAEGQVTGKLTHWAILRSLDPSVLQDDDVAALARAGLAPDFIDALKRPAPVVHHGLPRMCRVAARVRVRDAMVPVRHSIDEAASLVDAIEAMGRGHSQSLLVTADARVTGILRLSDGFEEVADLIRASD